MRTSALVLGAIVTIGSAAPAPAQDAVKVDPKHYKVEFENDRVRVLRIAYGPHEKSVMHEHPGNVAVFLTDGHVRFTLPDGKAQDASVKAGTVQWDAGGRHDPENLGDKPFELVLVELKGGSGAAPAMEPDPTKVDAKHYKVELENDRVRVLRIKYGPHERSVLHAHPDALAVFLTDAEARFVAPDGKTQDVSMKAGSTQWSAGGKHDPENLGDKPFELVLVELKGRP